MQNLPDKKQCCGCGVCTQICPKQCITMQADEEGFLYPAVNDDACIHCGLCEKTCPVRNVQPEAEGKPKAFAAFSRDEHERQSSSSGGIFSLLAEQVLECGGAVFGAEMAADCRSVNHSATESPEELCRLRGSKYLQSTIGSTYAQAKEFLDAGRRVLFSGTPCQIEGLKSFLKKDYDNLLCVDVICHGAPSPKLWEKYIDYREHQAGAAVQRTIFRHKKYGWKSYAVLLEFSNNTAYEQILSKDLYMQMFLQDLCLRPSCYDCKFKKLHRVSDITLADFWGCERVCPEMDDDRGLSAVLIHSDKGQKAFEGIQDQCVSRQVECSQIAAGNPALMKSCAMPEKRDAFMAQIDRLSIPRLAKKYLRKPSRKAMILSRIILLIPPGIRKNLKRILRR